MRMQVFTDKETQHPAVYISYKHPRWGVMPRTGKYCSVQQVIVSALCRQANTWTISLCTHGLWKVQETRLHVPMHACVCSACIFHTAGTNGLSNECQRLGLIWLLHMWLEPYAACRPRISSPAEYLHSLIRSAFEAALNARLYKLARGKQPLVASAAAGVCVQQPSTMPSLCLWLSGQRGGWTACCSAYAPNICVMRHAECVMPDA